MPHSLRNLPRAALSRARSVVLLLAVAACDRQGQLVIDVDTTSAEGPLEVLALPVAPQSLVRPMQPPSEHPAPLADSLARHAALTDSAASLDSRFQREREALNREVATLDSADRRTTTYAESYENHRRRVLAAERLRDARDAMRERLQELAQLLDPHLPSPERQAADRAAQRERMLGATDDVRRAITAPVLQGRAELSLAPGAWWIGVSSGHLPPASFDSVLVRPGARDSLRIAPGSN
jgi:hypothetical protein